MSSIAKTIRNCGGRMMAQKQAKSTWYDEFGNEFAYSFSDDSSIIMGGRTIVCSTKVLERWCKNGRIAKLLVS